MINFLIHSQFFLFDKFKVLPDFLWAKGRHKFSRRANKSPVFLESETHEISAYVL